MFINFVAAKKHLRDFAVETLHDRYGFTFRPPTIINGLRETFISDCNMVVYIFKNCMLDLSVPSIFTPSVVTSLTEHVSMIT